MAGGLFIVLSLMGDMFAGGLFLQVVTLGAVVIGGMSVYGAVLLFTKTVRISDFKNYLTKRS